MQSPVLLVVLSGVVLAAAPAPAHAWGREGHVVVAAIAQAHLSPKARAGLARLIGARPLTDPDWSNWPDKIRRDDDFRKTYPNNDKWHYIDIPFDAKALDLEREGRGDNNVVAAIGRFRKVLADRDAAANDRIEALKFLLHFVGDMHQPLHCAERNLDQGGNLVTVRVTFPTDGRPTANLHAAWDVDLLNYARGGMEAREYARRLDDGISAEQARAWAAGKVADWAWEAHLVAVQYTYRRKGPDSEELPSEGVVTLDKEYADVNKPKVEEQLKKAGIRLAQVLNEAFE
jgi:hypothetical protein